jgi:hypothetical protein
MNSESAQSAAIDSGNDRPESAFPLDWNSTADSALTEDAILALLDRRDLSLDIIDRLSKNPVTVKSRKARIALAAHPHTPRHVALRLIRQFYTFDLMQFSQRPAVTADLKRVADDLLVARLDSVTLGERLALARRSSDTVAAALLLDKEARVSRTALDNARLTEAAVIKALQGSVATAAFVQAVCHHAKWSPRREIRVALLRNPHTPLARALEFARTLPPPLLRDVLHASRLPEKVKTCLRKDLQSRK